MSEHFPDLLPTNEQSRGVYLNFVKPNEGWQEPGNCNSADQNMFHVTAKGSADPLRLADTYCASCPVADECLVDDILAGVTDATIRGGITRPERLRMHEAFMQHKPYTPARTQGQYRSPGFAGQMGEWRDGVINALQQQEPVLMAIEKQIEAGTVVSDDYHRTVLGDVQRLRNQLLFIQNEEDRL